jgi:hypothetical protein
MLKKIASASWLLLGLSCSHILPHTQNDCNQVVNLTLESEETTRFGNVVGRGGAVALPPKKPEDVGKPIEKEVKTPEN